MTKSFSIIDYLAGVHGSSDGDAPADLSTSTGGVPRAPVWLYLVPIVGAPLAHIFVSATTRFPQHKRLLWGAVGVSTVAMLVNRMVLMHDAGYPGSERTKPDRDPRDLK